MITLLNQTIDSLYLRLFSCSSPSIWLQSQLEIWRQYKQDFSYSEPSEHYIDLPNLGRFRLLHCGHSPYEFVLVNPEICDIRIYNPDKFLGKSAIQTGQIYLDFHSKYLQCQTDDYGLIDDFIENIYNLFYQATIAQWAKVSRVDLASDFSGFDFNWDDLNKFATRARKIDGLTTEQTLRQLEELNSMLVNASMNQPLVCDKGGCNDTSLKTHTNEITNVTTINFDDKQLTLLMNLVVDALNHPHLERVISTKFLQTAYIGRFGSKLYARIYNKSNEIKISGKDYLFSYWKEKGWQEGDQVTRAEFSLSGDFLKEFWATDENSQLWTNFRSNIRQIWTYCTSNWLRHTTGENSLNSRSLNSEFWDCVTTAFDTDRNFLRMPLPAPPTETLAGQLLMQAKGCIKTFAALIIGGYHKAFGFKHDEQIDYLSILVTEIGNDLQRDITFQDITHRRDRYGCDEFSDTAFSAALRKHRMKLGRGS